jgi:hypothetical protein
MMPSSNSVVDGDLDSLCVAVGNEMLGEEVGRCVVVSVATMLSGGGSNQPAAKVIIPAALKRPPENAALDVALKFPRLSQVPVRADAAN